MTGAQEAKVSIGWAYEMEYVRTSRFGYNGNGTPITGDKAREELTLWKDFTIPLGNLQTSRDNLGGWSLDVQHAYDPIAQLLYQGDGRRHAGTAFGAVVDTVPGTGGTNLGRGHIVTGPDGGLYIAATLSRLARLIPMARGSSLRGTPSDVNSPPLYVVMAVRRLRPA